MFNLFGTGKDAQHSLPFHEKAADAPAFWFDRALWIILTTPEKTGGSHACFDVTVAAGAGAAPHSHTTQDEVFVVLSGRAVFTVLGRDIDAKPGDLVHIPKGVMHSFKVPDSEPVRMLNYYAPGKFESFIMEAGVAAERHELPPKTLPPPDPQVMKAAATKVGLVMDPSTVG